MELCSQLLFSHTYKKEVTAPWRKLSAQVVELSKTAAVHSA